MIRLQKSYVQLNADCEGEPNVKGEIFLNARRVKFGRNVSLYPGVYLWGSLSEK